MQDMDAWGYSFRLGSTRDWFESDAEDAREFLMNHGLMTPSASRPSAAPVAMRRCIVSYGLASVPLYFLAVAFITWALTQMEIASPGSLKLHVVLSETDRYGTSEFSPVEIIQAIILGAAA